MRGRDYLGDFEHVVFLAVLRLGDQADGVTVRREIAARTKREVAIGAIYATLDRLEAKGYVQSRAGDPTPERGGRSKRFFRVTAQGVSAVSRTHRALRNLTKGLDILRSPSGHERPKALTRPASPPGLSICLPPPSRRNPSGSTFTKNSLTRPRNRESFPPTVGIGGSA